MQSEHSLELWLIAECKRRHALCLKMNQFIGVPDRLIMFPGKPAVFIELKDKSGRLSPAQISVHKNLRTKGHTVHVAYSKEELTLILNSI